MTTQKHGTLILTRRGESEWNAAGRWTGTRDVMLTEKGKHEARLLGEALQDIRLDYAFASQQIRSLQTLQNVLSAAKQPEVAFEQTPAFNERDYGDLTGLNKWQLKEKIGDEMFDGLRRGWDYPIPNGETLKDVYQRVIPFYLDHVVPLLASGKNVLITAHGNSGRSLMKYVESISNTEIANTGLPFGLIIFYTVDAEGKMLTKQERLVHEDGID